MRDVLYVLRMRCSIDGISCADEGGVFNMPPAIVTRVGKSFSTMVGR